MNLAILGYTLLFSASALVCLASIPRARTIQHPGTRKGLVALLAAVALWSGSYIGYLLAPTTGSKLALYIFGYVFAFVAVGAWLYFCAAYTGRPPRQAPYRRILITVFLLFTVLKITNPLHNLYFTAEWTTTPFPHLAIHHQLLHWIVLGLSYAVIAVGFFMLIERFYHTGTDSRPLVILAGLTGLPATATILSNQIDILLPLMYEPPGVALFAVGTLFVYHRRFEVIRLTSESGSPALFLDKDGRIRDYNRAAQELIPSLQGSIGQPLDTVNPTLSDGLSSADSMTVSRGEELHFYEVTTSPFMAGEVQTGQLVTITDVTDRELYRQQLEETTQKLEALNRVAHELMSADTQDEIVEIGVETTRDLLGIDANSIHLYDADAEGLVPVAATDTVYDLVGEPPTLTDGDSIAWCVYQQGESLAVDDVHEEPDRYNPDTPVRSELYLPLGEYGILLAGSPSPESFDEQDLLLAEILASGLATALEQVKQTEQLRAREQELTRQNDRLEEFASIVSHDLRNPLSVAKGRLELAAEECDSEHLEHVDRAHERMQTLIEDLLMLAREGEAIADLEPVALASFIEGCWASVSTDEATLVTDMDGTVQADRSRLKQLFENLIRNAVEHGGKGVTVRVGKLTDGFYIEDTGPGIPADERKTIFEAGYSTREDGTGFGLSIVKQIIDAHGWELHVTDGADGGARFEITDVEIAD